MDSEAALLSALQLLKRRLRSEAEVRRFLVSKGAEEATLEEVVATLFKRGLLDDTRYARAWVHDRDLLAPRSAFVLRQELRQRGVADAVIAAVLAERKDEAEGDGVGAEEAAARAILARVARRYASLPVEVRQRRLAALLQRRGFSSDLVRRILNV